MVLVDTSVWVRYLAGREPYGKGLDGLLEQGEVVGHEMVYGELLMGDRSGRARLLEAYARMTQAPVVSHAEVVLFVRHRRLQGRGLGWIERTCWPRPSLDTSSFGLPINASPSWPIRSAFRTRL